LPDAVLAKSRALIMESWLLRARAKAMREGAVALHARHLKTYDCFYFRPTNGRADDQVRRNHTTQYIPK